MRKYRTVFMCFLATLLVAVVAGCGQETVTLPGVASVTPAQGATGVPINTTVTATFNMAMKPASIDASTFILAGPGGAAPGAVTYSGKVATFTPNAVLAYGTTYTATITTGASSPGGAELIGPYVWSFTTIAATVPSVVINSVTPKPFAQNVPITGEGATISATFSLPMTAASTDAAFTVEAPGGVPVLGSASLSSNGLVATFMPSDGTLAYSTTYTATITTGATSLAQGTTLAGNYVWSFTTIAPNVPFVKSVTPLPFAQNVDVGTSVTATFSLPMNCATLNKTTFTITDPSRVAFNGAVTCSGNVATLMPGDALAYSTTYTATITTGATSTGGIPLIGAYVWTFTTITPPPTVTVVPVDGATGVSVKQVLTATFSEAMNCTNLKLPATFTVTGPEMTPVTGEVGCSGSVATFTPGTDLAFHTLYTATINGAQDPAGQAVSDTWSFWTVPAPTPLPQVTFTVPLNVAPPPPG